MNGKWEQWRGQIKRKRKERQAAEGMFGEVEEWVERAAGSYKELARVFSSYVAKKETFTRQEEQRILERVSGQLCHSCMKRNYCWERNPETSYAAFTLALADLESGGRIEFSGLPAFFQNNCICPQELVEELNFGISMEHMRLAAFNQMMEGREAIVRQLEETANYITSLPKQMMKEIALGEEVSRRLKRELRRYHVQVRELHLFERRGRGRQLRLRLKCDVGRSVSVRLVEKLLSEQLERDVRELDRLERLISEEEREMVFREEPEYFTMTGVAKLAKQEEEVSGDSFSFFYQEDGELAMILSDGMGSGEEAAKESESVLVMLEHLLEAGFEEETSIRLLNSVLALRAEQKSFATLDMSVLNLYTGVCEFVKIGASATFLKRKEWLECVEAETLPIGMVQNVDYDSLTKKLYDGDYVIMMSDGVLDNVKKEERTAFLKTVIGDDAEQNPQVIAGKILQASLKSQNFEPRDDMTVLVCGMFKRGKRVTSLPFSKERGRMKKEP